LSHVPVSSLRVRKVEIDQVVQALFGEARVLPEAAWLSFDTPPMPAPSVICGVVSAFTSSSPSAAHNGAARGQRRRRDSARGESYRSERALIGGIPRVVGAVDVGMSGSQASRMR